MITKQGFGSGVARHAPRAGAAFDAIIQNAVGMVRESGGLVSNIAGLCIALFVTTKGAAPARAPYPKPPPSSLPDGPTPKPPAIDRCECTP
jgi:hypothetical protein